jgi:putative aldouronate transport system permease protein
MDPSVITAPAPPAPRPPASPARIRRLTRWQRLRRDRSLLLMVAPALLLLLTFSYLPILGNVIAFQDYATFLGFTNSPFVGLDNFRRLFGDGAFWNAVRNTLVITTLQLVLFFPAAIGLALLLNSVFSTAVRRVVQTVTYLPHFISWVIVVALFQQVLGGAGVLNHFLLNNGGGHVEVMTNPDWFPLLVTGQGIWRDAGWGTIIFLAALSTIDPQQYESAAVDGAGRWQRLWHVTLPGIRPVIVLLLVLRLGEALSVGFEQILLQRDAVGSHAGEVLDTYVYFTAVINGDWSLGAAAGMFKALVGLALILAANRVAHALGEQGVYAR